MELIGHEKVISRKVYTIVFDDGTVKDIEELEAFRIRDNLVDKLPKIHPHIRFDLLEKAKTIALSNRPVRLDEGFHEIGRKPCDHRGLHKDSTYVLAKNNSTLEYGYKIVNGEESDFRNVGTLKDSQSLIGSFARRAIREGEFTKSEFMEKYSMNGTRLKAVLDILEIEEYLTAKTENRGKKLARVYRVTRKLSEELRGVSENVLGATQSPSVLTH